MYSINFYNDSSYNHCINADRVGYMDGSPVYMIVSVDASPNIVLLVRNLHELY